MIHFLILLVCISSIEILIRSNFSVTLVSLLKVTRKVINILPQNNISDHWKERTIPAYALTMMKYCLQMLLILLCILSLFFISGYFLGGFFNYSLSLIGIIEAAIFTVGYLRLRNFFVR